MTQPAFRKTVWGYYRKSGRHDLPWRHDITPYKILVSEVMLQQTQVSRVLEKYSGFLTQFPDFQTLAKVPARDILSVWNGLGYNRRALYLQRIAQIVVKDHRGKLPSDLVTLQNLPGIGAGTAGSIAAFAFNKPVVFIETNIRRVFIHHFFPSEILRQAQDDERGIADTRVVSDSEILPLIGETLDQERPREWYWALMDYGAFLATQTTNPNRRSRHYTKQSKFEGSPRQLRGEVLRRLLAGPQGVRGLPVDDRLPTILEDLVKEGFIARAGALYKIK